MYLSACEVKYKCCLFERLFKVKKNGVFLFEISFFVMEIFTFLFHVNQESDGVIAASTKTVQHSIQNISRKIKALLKHRVYSEQDPLSHNRVANEARKRLEPRVLPWQQLRRCHSVSFVMNISGAKFGEQCFNVSREILD